MLPINNTNDIKKRLNIKNNISIERVINNTDEIEELEEETNIEKQKIKNINIKPIKAPSVELSEEELNNVSFDVNNFENIDNLKIKKGKKINICLFQKINHNIPFIQFLLKKEQNMKETMKFLSMTYQSNNNISFEIIQYLKSTISFVSEDNLTIVGYQNANKNLYILVQYNEDKNSVKLINRKNKYWWSLLFEIIYTKNVCNFPVDKEVSKFLIKNIDSFILYKNKKKLSIPNVLYIGDDYKNINFTAMFGTKKSSHTSQLGPFYYFSEYFKAVRNGAWLLDSETNTQTEKIKQGGIVRFAIFYDSLCLFINHPSDKPDDSEIFKSLINDNVNNKSLLATQNVRDHDGDWTNECDCGYIGPIKNKETGKRISKFPTFVVKNSEQQFPLSYHKLDIRNFPDNFDSSKTNYYIQ